MPPCHQPRDYSVYFLTLGCPKNEVDSDTMAAILANRGFTIVQTLDAADIAIVNTCGFIRDAVEESISSVLDLGAWRDAAPDRRLVTVGCLVSRYGDDLVSALTESDAFVSLAQEISIADVLSALVNDAACEDATPATRADRRQPALARFSAPASAYVQVSDGCHRRCSFCTIPEIRGPYLSRPLSQIVDEVTDLVSRGTREIILIGQDISAYGRDLNSTNTLADVVETLAEIAGVDWLRLMYVQPEGVTDRLLDIMAAHENVCHYLDIPLQHASGRVLRSMRRNGDASAFLELLERIRSVMPDIVLRTTLIAGFPGESRADVTILDRFLREARLDYVGVFPFSPEDGTHAATLPGLPQRRTRLRRAQHLRDIADSISIGKMAERVGQRLTVLAEGFDEDGTPVGRWCGQAPEIDGLVLLDQAVDIGGMVTVEITDAWGYDLEGRVTA